MKYLKYWPFALPVAAGLLLLIFQKRIIRLFANLDGPLWDPESEAILQTLHPKFQPTARRFINAMDRVHGIKLEVRSGFRTYDEQQELYEQGRGDENTGSWWQWWTWNSEPPPQGSIVTNAQPGESWHNFGLAFDISPVSDKLNRSRAFMYDEAGRIGKQMGMEWGGDWQSFVDKPHFQYKTGKPLAFFRDRFENGNIDSSGFVNLA